jgi:hypothetical protein
MNARSFRNLTLFIAIKIILHAGILLAEGGPPLVTDDTETPGDGHWEINVASILTTSQNASDLELPFLDFNYGWGDHVQVKIESGESIVNQYGSQSGTQYGWGQALAGVKWRFLDQEDSGISLSTYPQFQFNNFLSTENTLIFNPTQQYILPVEIEKDFEDFGINPEVGMSWPSHGYNLFFYGVALGYQISDSVNLISEYHATHRIGDGALGNLVNVGARIEFTDLYILQWAIGHTLRNFPEEGSAFLVYLGLQLYIN